jgi:hypothetical protein
MKLKAKKLSLITILTAVFLILAFSAAASQPEELTIDFNMVFTGPDTAVGTFEATGAVNDEGIVNQEFMLAGPTVHGLKTLEGSEGTITIRFDGRSTPTGPTTAVVEGRFVILSGTGSYASLRGVGSVFTEADFVAGTLTGTYSGTAHYHP